MSYKIELNKRELFEISRLLNKEVKNKPELMNTLSKLSLAYYEPLNNELAEFIEDKFDLNDEVFEYDTRGKIILKEK